MILVDIGHQFQTGSFFLDEPPKGCRLTRLSWDGYEESAQPGYLFLVRQRGLLDAVNTVWQSRYLQLHPRNCWAHIGIIGRDRGCYESLIGRGPTRDFCLDRYLVGKGELAIAELAYQYDAEDLGRAMSALLYYMWRNKPGYDYLSLVSNGRWQMNGRTICSELVQHFANELCRNDERYLLGTDKLMLPTQWLTHVVIKWRG